MVDKKPKPKWPSQTEYQILSLIHELKTTRGLEIVQAILARGLGIKRTSVYSLLRRLEGKGLIESRQNDRNDPGLPHRYYQITTIGERIVLKAALLGYPQSGS